MQLEKKNLVFEIKQENINEQGIVFGYASTDDIDLDGDVIEIGAFQKSIDKWMINKKSIKALYQHKNSDVIGSIIELSYEGTKLKVAMQLYIDNYNNNAIGIKSANEAFYLAKQGELSFSVGFYNSDFTEEKKDGKYYRKIKEATLYEVSLVSFPANEKAVVLGTKSKNIKSLIENLQEPDICYTIKNLKSIDEFDCFCEDILQMPRKTRKAFKHFINEHIKSEVEKQNIQQPAPEFQKASDTSEPAPSDTSEVTDVKSTEITERILKTLNIN